MLFNRRKKKEKELTQARNQGTTVIAYSNPQSIYAEQFRTLRTNIEFAQLDSELKSLLVSSSVPAEGKSTISANLAIVMGQTDKKVLLVDSDLRKPTIHKTFRLNNEHGLTTLISQQDLHFNQVVQRSRELNLYFLPSGPIPPNPAEMLGSARMQALMTEFEQHFDLIIYDAPPLNAVADPQILASRVDGVVVVARHGYVRKEEIRQTKKALDNVNANVLGYVMNGQPISETTGYYGYYGYGADYQAAEGE